MCNRADDESAPVVASADGIVIGMSNLPLVNEGEALLHVARYQEIDDVENAVENFQSRYETTGF